MKLVSLLLLLCIASAAQLKNVYTLSKGYTVTIHGTSNLHNWSETVEEVTGESILSYNKNETFDLENIYLKLSVHSIKSEMGSIMNDNTYKALKADSHPEITFKLTSPIAAIPIQTSNKTISATGDLTIAGVTKSITMQVNVSMPNKQTLSFEGSQLIKMSDYNVEPPTALLGTLKTGNEITIHFNTTFTLSNH